MRHSKLLVLALPLFALLTSGCATRYQELLTDRDAEIRQLKGQLADSLAEGEDLRRERDRLRGELDGAGTRPVEASATDSELARVRDELPDLDVSRRLGRISIGIENTVTFDSGSEQLKSSAASVLQRVARVLNEQFPDRRIYVSGHTDTDPIRRTAGTYRSNRHLSVERADAVARWLIKDGRVPERQIAVVGYGPYLPRVAGSDDSAKARNRRVEVVVGEEL
ncbi:MAG: OmpA family protein [Planctomycetes bacterium]|nr:OmpA family protein [Planctomycetota bacterium]